GQLRVPPAETRRTAGRQARHPRLPSRSVGWRGCEREGSAPEISSEKAWRARSHAQSAKVGPPISNSGRVGSDVRSIKFAFLFAFLVSRSASLSHPSFPRIVCLRSGSTKSQVRRQFFSCILVDLGHANRSSRSARGEDLGAARAASAPARELPCRTARGKRS